MGNGLHILGGIGGLRFLLLTAAEQLHIKHRLHRMAAQVIQAAVPLQQLPAALIQKYAQIQSDRLYVQNLAHGYYDLIGRTFQIVVQSRYHRG